MSLSSKPTAALAIFTVIITAAALASLRPSQDSPPRSNYAPAVNKLHALCTLSSPRMTEVPLARMNLLCAEGLYSSNQPYIENSLSRMQTWANRVKAETERHRYRFQRNPAEFENSEGFFKMLMLTVVLAEDFGVHYSEQRKAALANARADDRFFANPSDVFLPGLLGPERQGTCSSMPVLYVAIGRELGYPLKLVTTKAHLFVRWDGAGERFNVEATSRGLARFDDDYYRHWPFEVTMAEEAAQGYLKSLTPPEELAVFLSIRGLCLRDNGRLPEATEAFAAATRLAPGCQGYRAMHGALQTNMSHLAAAPPTGVSANK